MKRLAKADLFLFILKNMLHHFPLIAPKDFAHLEQLIISEVAANTELAFQLLQGQGMVCWQAFSMMGYFMPMERVYKTGFLDFEDYTLWKFKLSGITFELIENLEFAHNDLEFRLLVNNKKQLIGSYPKKYKKPIDYIVYQSDFVRYVYRQQVVFEAIFNTVKL